MGCVGHLRVYLTFPDGANCQITGSPELSQSNLDKLSRFSKSLTRKGRSEMKIAKILFHKAHRRFLRNYHAYAAVNDLFELGNYDCLSGTYFLSQALTNLAVKHRIIETNYHVFLIAYTKQREVLMESTDRYGGFISDKEKIEERISQYLVNVHGSGHQLYLSNIKIYHEVLPEQLLGLMYYNLAVQSFNNNELETSCQHLKEAWTIYDNPRIEEFTPILLHAISVGKLDNEKKVQLTMILESRQHLATLANR